MVVHAAWPPHNVSLPPLVVCSLPRVTQRRRRWLGCTTQVVDGADGVAPLLHEAC